MYKGLWSCVLSFYSIFSRTVAYLLLCFSVFFISFVNYFFRFASFFSRALLRTFGDMGGDGEKKGGGAIRDHGIGLLGRCCMGFPTCFFLLVHCIFGLLGCYPGGLGCFFIPALKVVIFHLFVFRFFLISEKWLS